MPSVAEEDINVVFSHSKSVPSFKPSAVNIVSYELAVKMQDILKECQFKVVIAVRMINIYCMYFFTFKWPVGLPF